LGYLLNLTRALTYETPARICLPGTSKHSIGQKSFLPEGEEDQKNTIRALAEFVARYNQGVYDFLLNKKGEKRMEEKKDRPLMEFDVTNDKVIFTAFPDHLRGVGKIDTIDGIEVLSVASPCLRYENALYLPGTCRRPESQETVIPSDRKYYLQALQVLSIFMDRYNRGYYDRFLPKEPTTEKLHFSDLYTFKSLTPKYIIQNAAETPCIDINVYITNCGGLDREPDQATLDQILETRADWIAFALRNKLIEKRKKKVEKAFTFYINVYPDGVSTIYTSRKDADSCAREDRLGPAERITIIRDVEEA
jgi:hypothetical protein